MLHDQKDVVSKMMLFFYSCLLQAWITTKLFYCRWAWDFCILFLQGRWFNISVLICICSEYYYNHTLLLLMGLQLWHEIRGQNKRGVVGWHPTRKQIFANRKIDFWSPKTVLFLIFDLGQIGLTMRSTKTQRKGYGGFPKGTFWTCPLFSTPPGFFLIDDGSFIST